ncbi:MAG: flagellar biosynthetic protein FliQ [Deltaproteobacteria bacterium]|nr:flagellar biosynthetic protein FliQ [Deltaproteobacteria bacterium]
MFEAYLTKTFEIVIAASAVPLVAGSLAGVIVGVVQAATQVQEQSVTYLVRLFAVCCVIAVGGEILFSSLSAFLTEVLATIKYLGKM